MLDNPAWTWAALLDPSKTTTSFSFVLLDTNNTINKALRTLCFMYRKPC